MNDSNEKKINCCKKCFNYIPSSQEGEPGYHRCINVLCECHSEPAETSPEVKHTHTKFGGTIDCKGCHPEPLKEPWEKKEVTIEGVGTFMTSSKWDKLAELLQDCGYDFHDGRNIQRLKAVIEKIESTSLLSKDEEGQQNPPRIETSQSK